MEIKLDKTDLLKGMAEYENDVDFLFKIVNECTTNWESINELTVKLINLIKEKSAVLDNLKLLLSNE